VTTIDPVPARLRDPLRERRLPADDATVPIPVQRLRGPAVLPRPSASDSGHRVAVLVPAHDEQVGIAATIRSLRAQTRAPDRILVIADNCTDDTVSIAESLGVEILQTVGNRARKAGALNQGLARVLSELEPDDVVLTMDADSQLNPDFIENGLRYLHRYPRRGGISGSYEAADHPTWIGLMQKIEFTQGLRTVHRKAGKIHVLAGAATMFRVEALRRVAEARGSHLIPGVRGLIYLESSLTEDYELTVAIKRVGYDPRCAKDCRVVTDVMPTWHDWRNQRLRWQRGTMETLLMYGFVEHTRRAWAAQVWTYFRSIVPLLTLVVWSYALGLEHVTLHPVWMLIMPVFMLDQLIGTWRAGWRASLHAVVLLPVWVYDFAQLIVYWRALSRALRGTAASWTTA
jgi:cellulose synthase/poly-beta-1,6-N-acetylglucosamine synthase-like glycosyltransferase